MPGVSTMPSRVLLIQHDCPFVHRPCMFGLLLNKFSKSTHLLSKKNSHIALQMSVDRCVGLPQVVQPICTCLTSETTCLVDFFSATYDWMEFNKTCQEASNPRPVLSFQLVFVFLGGGGGLSTNMVALAYDRLTNILPLL